MDDSWLSNDDMLRIWRVVHGDLPQTLASEEECAEFLRVVYIKGMDRFSSIRFSPLTLQ